MVAEEVERPRLRPLGETTYQKWVQQENVPLHSGSHVPDLHVAAVAHWSRFGQKGAVINLADQEQDDGWLIEIAPGGQTEPMRHLCEATVFIVEGRGATSIWQAGRSKKQTVEWQTGSLFSPPLNCYYQHFNLDGQRPVRLFQATTAPLVMNMFRSPRFLFDCPSDFTERYDGSEDFFTNPGREVGERWWQTNLVPDTRTFRLDPDERGNGSCNMRFLMSSNAMRAHVSEFPTGTYKKAHRHGPGAELIILNGVGYSLLWSPGEENNRVKVDWQEGSVFSPRGGEYHQHFNTGPTPARYLAYTFGDLVIQNTRATNGSDVSEKEGGWQIEYRDEDPEVYALFERECANHGAPVIQPKVTGLR
ncbi:MAG: Gentisate 1,2-dioxygenase [Chloroflexi bacterium]|nr:Gentisate 1,2-dioxygenase [Chloroflexota bacterium]